MRLLPEDVTVAAAAQLQKRVRGIVFPYFGGAELQVDRIPQGEIYAVSHALLKAPLAAVSEETSGSFERTKFNINFSVTAVLGVLSDASVRGPRDFFFEGKLRKLGELGFLQGLLGGYLTLVGLHVGRHLDPRDLALDYLRGLALLALRGPQLQALSLAGVRAAGPRQVILGLGDAHPLSRRGVTLPTFPDRNADSLPPGRDGVTLNGLNAHLLFLRALGGRQALLILEFM